MRRFSLPLGCLLVLCSTAAQAQIHIGVELALPVVPELVVVAPGVQVVAGFQEEVFFQGGWYWCRRSDGWFRARSPRAHFDWVEGRRVPGSLTRMPVGQYRNWHRGGERGPEGRGHGQDMGRHEQRREEGRGRPEVRGHEEGRGHVEARGHEEGRGRAEGEGHRH